MKNKKVISIIVGIVLIVLDQIIKIVSVGKSITIIPDFLSFSYFENTNVAFGVGSNGFTLIVLASIALIAMIILFIKKKNQDLDFKLILSLVFILAGCLGNLIDMIFLGYVRDYIYVKNMPIMNIADIFEIFGIVFLIVVIIISLVRRKKENTLS